MAWLRLHLGFYLIDTARQIDKHLGQFRQLAVDGVCVPDRGPPERVERDLLRVPVLPWRDRVMGRGLREREPLVREAVFLVALEGPLLNRRTSVFPVLWNIGGLPLLTLPRFATTLPTLFDLWDTLSSRRLLWGQRRAFLGISLRLLSRQSLRVLLGLFGGTASLGDLVDFLPSCRFGLAFLPGAPVKGVLGRRHVYSRTGDFCAADECLFSRFHLLGRDFLRRGWRRHLRQRWSGVAIHVGGLGLGGGLSRGSSRGGCFGCAAVDGG
jgi:hypothetical protein